VYIAVHSNTQHFKKRHYSDADVEVQQVLKWENITPKLKGSIFFAAAPFMLIK